MAATAASQGGPRCTSLLRLTALIGVGGSVVHGLQPPRGCRWAATGVDILALKPCAGTRRLAHAAGRDPRSGDPKSCVNRVRWGAPARGVVKWPARTSFVPGCTTLA